METLRDIFNSYKSETVSAEGLTIDIDGIECCGLYGNIKKISLQNKVIYKGIGEAIFVDKNHDLSFYINGSDHLDSGSFIDLPNTFGYEWGGYNTTAFTAADIGAGLLNTNTFIEINSQPNTSGWPVVWDKIKEFRQSHSDNWFLPSKDELNLIYMDRANLNNLSLNINSYYWSSSKLSSDYAWLQNFSTGRQYGRPKDSHGIRSRLCVQH